MLLDLRDDDIDVRTKGWQDFVNCPAHVESVALENFLEYILESEKLVALVVAECASLQACIAGRIAEALPFEKFTELAPEFGFLSFSEIAAVLVHEILEFEVPFFAKEFQFVLFLAWSGS